MKQRLAIIEGYRSPFCKAGSAFKAMHADQLGAVIVRELMARSALQYNDIDEVIIGNVAQPGLIGVAPGSGEITCPPVSVCQYVSTIAHLLLPTSS